MNLTLRRLRQILRESIQQSEFAPDPLTGSIFADPVVQVAVQEMRRKGWMNWTNFKDWEGDREELKDVPVGWWVLHWYADPSSPVTDSGVWAIGEVLESWIDIGEMTLKVKFLNYVRATGVNDDITVEQAYTKEIHNWWMVADAVMQGSPVTNAMAEMMHAKAVLDWRPTTPLPEDDYSL